MNKRNDPDALTDSYEVTVTITQTVLVRHASSKKEAEELAKQMVERDSGMPVDLGADTSRLEAWEVNMVVGSADYVV